MKKSAFLLVVFFCVLALNTKAQETLTNQSIISLVTAKVSNTIITSKIKSSANNFDLSTSGMTELKNQKVSESIMEEMIMASKKLPPMKNEDVIALFKNKIGKNTILKKMSLSACNFDTGTDALIALKNAGVPESITKVMMNPNSSAGATESSPLISTNLKDHPQDLTPPSKLSTPGIYYEQFIPKQDYVMVEPTTTNQTKKGGFGQSVANHYSGGISGITSRVGLSGANSSTTIEDKRPVFYFYLNMDAKDISQAIESKYDGVASPKDFVLVKATQTKRGREIEIARKSAFTEEKGFAKGTVEFKIKKVSDRLYKVYFEEDVPAGEYAFYYNKSSEERSQYKLYDFSLRNNISEK